MINPQERVEDDLSPADRSNAIFYIGKIGTKELVEIPVPYIASPDGYIGVAASQLRKLAEEAETTGIIWMRTPSTQDEGPPTSEIATDQTVIAGGRVVIDHKRVELVVDGTVHHLQPKQFMVLEMLAKNLGRPVGRNEVLDYGWGRHEYIDAKTVSVHVSNLRKILGTELKQLLLTRHGTGYVLEEHLREHG